MRVENKPRWVPGDAWRDRRRWPGAREVMLAESCKGLWVVIEAEKAAVPLTRVLPDLFGAIAHSLRQGARLPSFPKTLRKRHATKIANAVEKLEKELDAISGEPGGLPLSIDLELSWLDGMPTAERTAIDHRLRELLPKLATAVANWADAPPLISHVTAEGAPRLLMARNVKRVFLQRYARPMDGLVIAICEVFYGPSDFDSSTLRKVAPAEDLLNRSL